MWTCIFYHTSCIELCHLVCIRHCFSCYKHTNSVKFDLCVISRAVVQTAGRAADKQDCGSSRLLDCLKKLTVVASLFVTDRKPSSSESFAQKWAQMSLCCCQKTCSCKTDSFPTTDTLNASQYKRNSQQSHSHLFSLCCYFSHEFILLFLKSSSLLQGPKDPQSELQKEVCLTNCLTIDCIVRVDVVTAMALIH